MEEIKKILVQINTKLAEFVQHNPRPDWSQNTKEELLLDFAFHSNKIEGLNLSYGETISFLKNGLIENKLLSQPGLGADISMLQNHQRALNLIFSQYEGGYFSTDFIAEVHHAILSTDTYLDDELKPGIYRGDDICVRKSNGELKYFLIDTKISGSMADLVERTNNQIKNADFNSVENHPFVIATGFHVDFLNIHPFRDGNGRTARLLMNMVNMRFKIPPFSPKSDKESRLLYFEAFDKVDSAQSNYPMVEFLGKQLLEVMEDAIQKAKGY